MSTYSRRFKRLHRLHKLNRQQVDSLGWPHPRPAADERLMGLHLAFIWTSVIQIIFGPPPVSVQGLAFSYVATVAFSLLLIFCSMLAIYAARCKSQYDSFGVEMVACIGFTGVFAIYSIGAVVGITDWFATNTAAIAVALFGGECFTGDKARPEAVVNTGAIITAVGGILTVMTGTLVGWLVKRTDRVAKLTQSNMQDQEYILRLVGVLRNDYWAMQDWAYGARSRYREIAAQLRRDCPDSDPPPEELPDMPYPTHRDMEKRHNQGEPMEDKDRGRSGERHGYGPGSQPDRD